MHSSSLSTMLVFSTHRPPLAFFLTKNFPVPPYRTIVILPRSIQGQLGSAGKNPSLRLWMSTTEIALLPGAVGAVHYETRTLESAQDTAQRVRPLFLHLVPSACLNPSIPSSAVSVALPSVFPRPLPRNTAEGPRSPRGGGLSFLPEGRSGLSCARGQARVHFLALAERRNARRPVGRHAPATVMAWHRFPPSPLCSHGKAPHCQVLGDFTNRVS